MLLCALTQRATVLCPLLESVMFVIATFDQFEKALAGRCKRAEAK